MAAFLCCLLALLIDLIGLQHTEHHGILLAGREPHMRKLRARCQLGTYPSDIGIGLLFLRRFQIDQRIAAAHAAQCDDILEKLPQGLDTVVGARGVYLSGGEQQRIALARAILKDAPIVVLDEATAFADPENEHQIQKAFETLTRNKTVLMIAHRLSTVQNADNIIVLNEGKIAEQGSHSALLEKNGVYAAMWADYQRSAQWKVGKEAAV